MRLHVRGYVLSRLGKRKVFGMLLIKIKGYRAVKFLECVVVMAGIRRNCTGREGI
eukprot:COSAG06_NODE_6129_length_3095_cov_8.713952_4_plen_55_part_00